MNSPDTTKHAYATHGNAGTHIAPDGARFLDSATAPLEMTRNGTHYARNDREQTGTAKMA